MNSKIKPGDVVLGTADERAWTQLKKDAIAQNENNVRMIAVNEAVIELCNKKIAEEKEKLK